MILWPRFSDRHAESPARTHATAASPAESEVKRRLDEMIRAAGVANEPEQAESAEKSLAERLAEHFGIL